MGKIIAVEEKNLQIAKMLGYKISNDPYKGVIEITPNSFKPEVVQKYIGRERWYAFPQFHEDWNWLMMAVQFLETFHNMKDKPFYVSMIWCGEKNVSLQVRKKVGGDIYWENFGRFLPEHYTSIETVFELIARFAELYNNPEITKSWQ